MALTTGTYGFDEALFDRPYDGFERGFGAEQIHMVEFLPLNGFEPTETVVLLPDGLVLRRMSDRLMSAAIDHLAVPRMSAGGGVNGARVSRFDQWALTTAGAYPVADGRPIAAPPAVGVSNLVRAGHLADHGVAHRMRRIRRGHAQYVRPGGRRVPDRPRRIGYVDRVRWRGQRPVERHVVSARAGMARPAGLRSLGSCHGHAWRPAVKERQGTGPLSRSG